MSRFRIGDFFHKLNLKYGFEQKFYSSDELSDFLDDGLTKLQKQAKKKYPIRWWLFKKIPDTIDIQFYRKIINPYNTAVWTLQNFLWYRVNIIKTAPYSHYRDIDHTLETAMQILLFRFVEDECAIMGGGTFGDTKAAFKFLRERGKLNPEVKKVKGKWVSDTSKTPPMIQVIDLYNYFKKELPRREKLEKKMLNTWARSGKKKNTKKYEKLFWQLKEHEDQTIELTTLHLTQLISIRKHLWT